MFFRRHRKIAPLWSCNEVQSERSLALWKAFLVALIIEFIFPVGSYWLKWQGLMDMFEKQKSNPVMIVKLDQPPTKPEIRQKNKVLKKEKEKPELELKKIKNTLRLEPPKPLVDEIPAIIDFPKPELKPKKKKKKKEEELPALPSVFQDPCPVSKNPFPVYPRAAEEKKVEGEIELLITVDDDGYVINARVLYAEHPGVFDQEVLEKVKGWQFRRFCKKGPQFIQRFIFKIDPWSKS
jgi:TonB family protein